jgi:hypothetical protein
MPTDSTFSHILVVISRFAICLCVCLYYLFITQCLDCLVRGFETEFIDLFLKGPSSLLLELGDLGLFPFQICVCSF